MKNVNLTTGVITDAGTGNGFFITNAADGKYLKFKVSVLEACQFFVDRTSTLTYSSGQLKTDARIPFGMYKDDSDYLYVSKECELTTSSATSLEEVVSSLPLAAKAIPQYMPSLDDKVNGTGSVDMTAVLAQVNAAIAAIGHTSTIVQTISKPARASLTKDMLNVTYIYQLDKSTLEKAWEYKMPVKDTADTPAGQYTALYDNKWFLVTVPNIPALTNKSTYAYYLLFNMITGAVTFKRRNKSTGVIDDFSTATTFTRHSTKPAGATEWTDYEFIQQGVWYETIYAGTEVATADEITMAVGTTGSEMAPGYPKIANGGTQVEFKYNSGVSSTVDLYNDKTSPVFVGDSTLRTTLEASASWNTKDFLLFDTNLHMLLAHKAGCRFFQYRGQKVGTTAPTSPVEGTIWQGTETVYSWDATNEYWKVVLSNWFGKFSTGDTFPTPIGTYSWNGTSRYIQFEVDSTSIMMERLIVDTNYVTGSEITAIPGFPVDVCQVNDEGVDYTLAISYMTNHKVAQLNVRRYGTTLYVLSKPIESLLPLNIESTVSTDSTSVPSSLAVKNALDAKANSSHTHTIAQVNNLQTTLDSKLDKNASITGASKCKITYDSDGLVTAGADLDASDIPNLDASKITSGAFDIARIPTASVSSSDTTHVPTCKVVYDALSDKVAKNTAITGSTKCKITYDSKGLVTGGSDLAASDIPSLDASKITSGTLGTDRIPSLSATKITSGTLGIGRIPTGSVAGQSTNNVPTCKDVYDLVLSTTSGTISVNSGWEGSVRWYRQGNQVSIIYDWVGRVDSSASTYVCSLPTALKTSFAHGATLVCADYAKTPCLTWSSANSASVKIYQGELGIHYYGSETYLII